MKNKASLSLMEQLVMILVFALAAALCLGAFARADSIHKQTSRRETAVQIAQNGAEILKSGGELEDLSLPEGYTLALHPLDADTPGLALAEIAVSYEEDALFTLKTAWQEVAP